METNAPVAAPVVAPPVVAPEDRPTQPVILPLSLRIPRRAGWVALAGVLAVAGVGLVMARSTPSPVVLPSASAVAPAPVAVAPAVTPAPVSLTVRSLPEGARVVRADTGEVLGVTPWETQMPPSTGSLGLRLELAGYAPSEHQLRLDASSTLEVPLVRAPAKAARGTTAPTRASTPRTSLSRKSPGGPRDAIIDPFAP